MLNSHDVAVAIQDWTKSPHSNKIWVFNSIDKGWVEVPKEEIGKLFLIEGKEDYSFICAGKEPVTLNYANGIYFMPGISIAKLKTMIEIGGEQDLYCPSLIKEEGYDTLSTIATDIKLLEYVCKNGLLYTDQWVAAEAGYILFDKNYKVK